MRKRLWQGGAALLLFIATLAVGNFFVASDKAVSRKSAGHDFLAFYTAGTFVRTGRSAELYDLSAVKSFEQEIAQREHLELGADDFGPYWNPPFFAWVFVPLSMLSYANAWTLWFAINLVCVTCATAILCRILRDSRERKLALADWGLVPLLICTSLPFIQSLGHGQNTCMSLLLLSATVALWRSGRLISAGVIAGLLFYKPQLGALIAGAIVLRDGIKPLAGLALSGSALLLLTLLTLPHTLLDFLQKLPGNVTYMQVEHRYLWERHVTLKSFWRLLTQGYEVGDLTVLTRILYLATTIALATALVVMIVNTRRIREGATRLSSSKSSGDRMIAATIAAAPLLMPFYFDYDLLLLSVAAVLTARDARENGIDKPLLIAWIALYAWLFVNPPVAGRTHVNGTVLLLSGVATILIARTLSLPGYAGGGLGWGLLSATQRTPTLPSPGVPGEGKNIAALAR